MSTSTRWLRILAGAAAVVAVLGASGTQAAASTSQAPAGSTVLQQSENVVAVTSANHQEIMNISQQKLVILDFGATWCPPCQKLKPVIEKLAKEYNGKFLLGEVDVDVSRDLSSQYKIQYIPTLAPIRKGTELPGARQVGFPGESKLRAWIDAQLAKG